ncbi:hypothetical protein [Nitratireductor alexandrii]|uniref:hypothetical protein n=1 Tax=Nitratireductor alexandrii TaxID=2448161 RepID=UPI000FD6D7F3|nr:hypothetical protein [Nitratireductor alexandrii]
MEDIYLPADRYAFNAAYLVKALRKRHPDPDTRRDHIHAALRTMGLDMGGLCLTGGRIAPEHHGELLDALLDLEPSAFTGEIDLCSVKLALGEHGGIWPASIRETPAENSHLAS